MKVMGRHSPPIDGVTVTNGHHLEPFTIPPSLQVRPRGPVSLWPQPVMPGRWQRVRAAVTSRGPLWRACLAAVPVVLVNVVASGAQLGYWRAHLGSAAEAAVVAVALESIAIYLSWQAHRAQLADDPSLRLRLAAYGMALGIGALNYSHFDGPGWRLTVPAVTFGLMSAISPWLWSVHSRRVSRDALKARGLIEPHAVRLGATRWQWHPIRSVRVMSQATWTGETDPSAAIGMWHPRKAAELPADGPVTVTDDGDVPAPPGPPGGVPAPVSDAPVPPAGDVTAKPRKRTPPPSAGARVRALLTADPTLKDDELMKRAKASKSTVERARRELAKASS